MHPVLFKLGNFIVYSYGLMAAAGVGIAAFLVLRRAKRLGIPEDVLYNLVVMVIVAGILGGRLTHVLAEWSYYRKHLIEVLFLRQGGLAIQGAVLFGLVSGVWYLRAKKVPALPVTDVFFLYLPVGQAVGRLGCLLNGCCYGKPAEIPFAVQFPFLPYRVHPTQVYDALANLSLFFVLSLFAKTEQKSGVVTGWYFVLYGFSRWVLDNFRGDLLPRFLGFYTTQWYAMFFTFLGIGLLLKRSFHGYSGSKVRGFFGGNSGKDSQGCPED